MKRKERPSLYLPRFYAIFKLQIYTLLQECSSSAIDLKFYDKGVPAQTICLRCFQKLFLKSLVF